MHHYHILISYHNSSLITVKKLVLYPIWSFIQDRMPFYCFFIFYLIIFYAYITREFTEKAKPMKPVKK